MNKIIEHAKNDLFPKVFEYGKAVLIDLAKEKATNAFLDGYINKHVKDTVKVNTLWNLLFLLIICGNQFYSIEKLFNVYYFLSRISTFYFVSKILSVLGDTTIKFVADFLSDVAWIIDKARSYFNYISLLMVIEMIGIVGDWNVAYIIYPAIIGLTIHTLTINIFIIIIKTVYKLTKINDDLRFYCYVYLIQNTAVLILYYLIN